PIELADRPPPPPGQEPEGNIYPVTPGFFEVLRVPLLSGRLFSEADGNRDLVVIDENFARKLFPGQSPLGKRLRDRVGPGPEIIGVVGHAQNYSLDGSGPVDMAFYVPYQMVARRAPGW